MPRKTYRPPNSICHECGRHLRSIDAPNIEAERLPRHKADGLLWCRGSGAIVEEWPEATLKRWADEYR